jgi:hypothetical protein
MLWLKSLLNCPPGEFSYAQGRQFDRTPLVHELASSVADFRKGNGLPRASKMEALEDIVVYTVARIGGNLEYCYETDLSPGALLQSESPGSSCAGCGASVT